MSRNFQERLGELGVEWFPSVEASSVDLIETYVANGLGIGVAVPAPKRPLPANVRRLALPGFAPVVVGALWRGKPTPVLRAFLEEMQSRARNLVEPATPAPLRARLLGP